MNSIQLLGLVVFLYFNVWFGISLWVRRNDVADIAWGLGFAVVAWMSYIIACENNLRGVIVNSMVSLWGVRLAWHIWRRNKNKTEDSRYAEWRKQWGKIFLIRSYVQVFLLQGLLLSVISLPVVFVNLNQGSLKIWDIIGIIVWVIGFGFEAVGDAQLSRYLKNPYNRGKILDQGLWKYTRHPNYFGEVTMWWGIFLITLSLTDGWMTVVGPIAITILIVYVSGIPLLEKKYAGRSDFEEYKKRTSVFFPMPPRENQRVMRLPDSSRQRGTR